MTTTTTTTTRNVVLALDVGSSSVRCSAYRVVDPDDRLVPLERARASEPTAGVCAATGAVPVADVLEAVDRCVDQVLRELRDDDDDDDEDAKGESVRPTIVAVGFSTFAMNLVGLDDDDDDDDRPTTTTATLSYACRRHRDKAEAIERALGGPEGALAAYRRTGAPVRPAYAAPQLEALRDDATTRVSRWTTLSALCLSRWTGVAPTRVSYSEAAWTGLLNASTATWDEELLSVLPPDLPLPEPVDPLDHVVTVDHTVDTPYVVRWPELFVPRRTAFLLGDGDGACANVGSKCTSSMSTKRDGGTPHRVAVTIGTSAAVRVLVHRPLGSSVDVPPGLFAYRVDANSILVGGALTDGGSVVEWTRGLVLGPTKGENEDSEEWERLVTEATTAYDAADASSHRPVVVIPFLSGERSTGFRADATGAICGLTRRTTKADLLRAGLEGVVLRLRRVLSLMTPLLSPSTNDDDDVDFVLVASGAGLQKSPLWRRMIADAAGAPVVVDAEAAREGTSRGAARTAATAARRRRGTSNENNASREEELVEEDRVVPDPHKRAYWNALEAAQEEFIEAVSVMW